MTELEHRHLRSGLEFVVLVAAEGQKRRPPLDIPKDLKRFLGPKRLPSSALGRVRRIVEGDEEFRASMSAVAVPELVDEVGRLWLEASADWEQRAAEIVADQEAAAESNDLRRELKRSEKRRSAAEQATARVQAEILVRDQTIATMSEELDELRADVAKATDQLTEVRTELVDTRNELRHARDREHAAIRRAEQAQSAAAVSAPADVSADVSAEVSSDRLDELLDARRSVDEMSDRLHAALAASRTFSQEMDRLLVVEAETPSSASGRSRSGTAERVPIALPGGVISTSARAAEHLVRSDAVILIDGYNVAKLGWPDRSLEAQRDVLISRCENLARRHGGDVTIVFDGASVVGAHASQRRSVRVLYSPSGVTADDVIRSEVDRLPTDRAVVVVTNDREIVDDVRRVGANVVPSNAFIAVM